MRLAQRRSVVGAVAAHADGVPALLKRLHEVIFVLRKDTRKDGEGFWLHVVRDGSRWTDGANESHLARNDGRRRRGIPRHHHGTHAERAQLLDELGRIAAWRVAQ